MATKDSRIFNAWGGAGSKSPYETEAQTDGDWRADSKAEGLKGKGAGGKGHHRRNSSSLARWFSNFGKTPEPADAEPEDDIILNHAEDVDVARFTSDLLNDGYRYSTKSLLKAVEVPNADLEEIGGEFGHVERIRASLDSLSLRRDSPSSTALTPRAVWESATAWSVSESNALSEDAERLALGHSPRMEAVEGAGSNLGWGGDVGSTRRSSYRVLWDTLTKKQERKEKTPRKQKCPVDFVKATVLSLKPHPEAFATSVPLRKNLAALEGDSRALAALMKDLSKHGASNRAGMMFDMIRAVGREDPEDPVAALADLYTYTTAISQCGYTNQRLNRALEIFSEMKARGITTNIHAYSALMGVCVKQNECNVAISIFRELEADGVEPNLVTYNILVDAYNKLGMLQSSVEALEQIKGRGLLPEARTYNSVISACGKANKGMLALEVYNLMLKDGVGPTNTTYTSAISACGRSGMVDEAMDLYRSMPSMGCQPNVITFSSLISVCERVGDMGLALTVLDEMIAMGVAPNLVTYNGLLGCFAKAGAWQDALKTVEEMQSKRIDLDSTSYSAVVTACSRAVPAKWREAITYAEEGAKMGYKLEAGTFTSLLGCLWSTGGYAMQRRALQMLSKGGDANQIKIRFNEACESSVTSDSASACCLAMLSWITGYRQDLRSASTYNKPFRSLVISQGKYACVGSAKEDVTGALKAMIASFSIPAHVIDTGKGRVIKTDARHIATWILTPPAYLVKSLLDIEGPPVKGGRNGRPWSAGFASTTSSTAALQHSQALIKDEGTHFAQCDRAMTAINAFEASEGMFSRVPQRNIDAFNASIELRHSIIQVIVNMSGALNLNETICHDSVQISNKLLAHGVAHQLPPPPSCAAALLLISCRINGVPNLMLKNGQTLEASFDVNVEDALHAESIIKQMLGSKPRAISPIRVLSLMLNLLYSNEAVRTNVLIDALFTNATGLVSVAAVDASLAFTPPSIVAAACLSTCLEQSGMNPWPTLLFELTGISEHDDRLVNTLARIRT
jgi:pentatricopeptide repeat domain-containing protein 1